MVNTFAERIPYNISNISYYLKTGYSTLGKSNQIKYNDYIIVITLK